MNPYCLIKISICQISNKSGNKFASCFLSSFLILGMMTDITNNILEVSFNSLSSVSCEFQKINSEKRWDFENIFIYILRTQSNISDDVFSRNSEKLCLFRCLHWSWERFWFCASVLFCGVMSLWLHEASKRNYITPHADLRDLNITQKLQMV